jgi:(S)-2-hydroxy-acid oxidase
MNLVSLSEFEREAHKVLPKNALDYYKSGAGDEYSLRLNRTAFEKIRIRPRCLIDVSNRTSECEVFGVKYSAPIGISPTAMQKMAHPEGENAVAKAAKNQEIGYTLSTIATSSIEEVGQSAPDYSKWFQLYIYKDRGVTERLVRRAEENGFTAIVLTVDAPIFGLRRADLKNHFSLPPHLTMANFTGELATGVKGKGGSGINQYVASLFDASLNWQDVEWLLSFTKLPVLVKGILTKEDAELAVEAGVHGIIVSNHGARQIDSVPATVSCYISAIFYNVY